MAGNFAYKNSAFFLHRYNRFIVAANFMADWEHQNPKPGTEVDPDFETYKVKEQKFKLFMEDYFQVLSTSSHPFFIAPSGQFVSCKNREIYSEMGTSSSDMPLSELVQIVDIVLYSRRKWSSA